MIRVTLDTNILASSAIARAGSVAILFNRWRSGHYELAVSDHIIGELAGLLAKPYFAARLAMGAWAGGWGPIAPNTPHDVDYLHEREYSTRRR